MAVQVNPNVLEEQVLSFVAQHRQTDPGKLSSTTRLAQDLGMQGEDATEFLKEFSKAFSVNPDGLRARWRQHFSPEGRGTLFAIAAMVVCVAAGFRLAEALGILPAWGWGLLLIVLFLLSYQRWRRNHAKAPITIADLIEAARSGRWTGSREPTGH